MNHHVMWKKKSSLQHGSWTDSEREQGVFGGIVVFGLFLSFPHQLKTRGPEVLKRSPDLLYNIKICQLQLIMKHILIYHIVGLQPFWSCDLKQSNEYSITQPSDFYLGMWQSK